MDFYSDTSRGTLNLAKQVVKTVDLEKIAGAVDAETSGLPDSSFADPNARLFPVHTPEDTALSAVYAFMGEKISADTTSAILRAAELWGNKDVILKVAEEIRTAKNATAEKFALDMDIGGKHYQLFPFSDSKSLKEASESFFHSRAKLPWGAREKVARTLFEEILSYGGNAEIKADEAAFKYITKAAGFGIPDSDSADAMLLQRMNRVPAHQDSFRKVARIIREAQSSLEWDKYAMEAFDILDTEIGVKEAYGRTLRLPEEDLYVDSVIDVKTASEQGIVQLMNGKSVRLSDIDWSKVAHVDPVLYEETQGGTQKAAEILPTWPRPDADLLMEMLGLEAVA